MNSSPPKPDEDARFESWMNRQTSADPLPDDGFSARVLTALPPSRRAFPRRRVLICVVGGLIGALATRLDLGEWPTVASMFEPVSSAVPTVAAFLSDPWMAAALAGAVMLTATVAAIMFALREVRSTEICQTARRAVRAGLPLAHPK